jgi:ubiquitin C-terminal hydrolase
MNPPPNQTGYTGLANLGNTCFLNSCVQVLNHTIEFDDIFDKFDKYAASKQIPENNIIQEFRELRTLMFSNNGVVSPNKFVHNVHVLAQQKGREIFTGWAQNDMPEFLLFMVECMHNCISRGVRVEISGKSEHALDELAVECFRMIQSVYSKEYSEIMELFYGTYVSEIWNIDKTKRHSIKPETYFILDLPIPPITYDNKPSPAIHFLGVPTLSGETNATLARTPELRSSVGVRGFACEAGVSGWRPKTPTGLSGDGLPSKDNGPTSIYDCFRLFTKCEVLTGDNAWWNETTQQKEEISKNITFWNFPKVLVITLKRFSPDGQYKNNELIDFPIDTLDLSPFVSGYKPKSFVYELYGICNHIGNVHGGHYTAFVKRGEQWIHFNDTSVSIIPNIQELITPMAYCLFYRKKNTTV